MPPETVATDNQEWRFAFQRLIVRRALFELVERAPLAEGESRPATIDASLQIGASIRINPETLQSVLTLDVKVLPDLKWQPYRVEMLISGVFVGEMGTVEVLGEFSRLSAPAILFPYIREAVHRMTMDAPFGPLRLNPINIQEMLNRGPWAQEETISASNEPPPPSAQ
jgi:preprotein translocase subunit SecB